MIKVEDHHVSLKGTNAQLQDEFEHLLLAMTSREELLDVVSSAFANVNEHLKTKGGI